MSNSEMAAFLEKETLRDAEESDYQLMEDLLQHRIEKSSSGDVAYAKFDNNVLFCAVSDDDTRSQARLQRSGAIEIADNQTDPDNTQPGKIDVHSEPAEPRPLSEDVVVVSASSDSLSSIQPQPQLQHFCIEISFPDSRDVDNLSENVETTC